jgi:DNA-binding transcriptional regulator YdaS (Cro superfamily)
MSSLAQYLDTHSMSPTEFARRLGVRDTTVLRWAADTRTPSVTWALAIERHTDGAVPVASWTEGLVQRRKKAAQAKKARAERRLVRGSARRSPQHSP